MDTGGQGGGHWVTMAEAAAMLGKSTRTVRRYIADGKLEIDKTRTPNLVNVSDMADSVADSGGNRVQELEAANEALQAKVDRLALENTQLHAANEALEQAVARVERENDRLWESHRADQINMNELAKAAQGRPSIWDRLLPWRTKGDDE